MQMSAATPQIVFEHEFPYDVVVSRYTTRIFCIIVWTAAATTTTSTPATESTIDDGWHGGAVPARYDDGHGFAASDS